MPSLTWPQAFVLIVAMGGTFTLAHYDQPAFAAILALASAYTGLMQRSPTDRKALEKLPDPAAPVPSTVPEPTAPPPQPQAGP
jgi:hypothetical protein